MEVNFLDRVRICKRILGNTTMVTKLRIEQALTTTRRRVEEQNVTFPEILNIYESDTREHLTTDTEYHWEKTSQYKLWKGLRSHKVLLDSLQPSGE